MINITPGEQFDDNGDTCLPLVSQDVASLMAQNDALSTRVERLERLMLLISVWMPDLVRQLAVPEAASNAKTLYSNIKRLREESSSS